MGPVSARTAYDDELAVIAWMLIAAIYSCESMNTTLFDRLRELNLPSPDYAIFGSGPLAIRGIVPLANDLDILCRENVWAIVSQLGTIKFLPAYNVTVATLSDGAITFGMEWGIGDFDVDELIDSAEIIDALPFVRLEYVVRYKKIRSSAKDILHLDAIKASSHLK